MSQLDDLKTELDVIKQALDTLEQKSQPSTPAPNPYRRLASYPVLGNKKNNVVVTIIGEQLLLGHTIIFEHVAGGMKISIYDEVGNTSVTEVTDTDLNASDYPGGVVAKAIRHAAKDLIILQNDAG